MVGFTMKSTCFLLKNVSIKLPEVTDIDQCKAGRLSTEIFGFRCRSGFSFPVICFDYQRTVCDF